MKMQKLFFAIMLVLSIAFASSSFADTIGNKMYTVKSGDSLSKIAKKSDQKISWQELYKANARQIKNPSIIFPGQELLMPWHNEIHLDKREVSSFNEQAAAGTRLIAVVKANGEFNWTKPNGNPFGSHRDYAKAINMFKLPTEVKTAMIAAVKDTQPESINIKSGDRFAQMIFGNYRIVNNVVAKWTAGRTEKAEKWSLKFDSEKYYLVKPLICSNWAWQKEKVTEEIAPPPAVKEPGEKPVEKVEEKPLVVIPQPEVLVEEPVPVIEPQLIVSEKAKEPCQTSWESYGWAGYWKSLKGNGQSIYYGGKANYFFCEANTACGKMRGGVGATVNGWAGNSLNYDFTGQRFTLGPVADLTVKSGNRYTITTQLGQDFSRGHDDQGYKASQDTKILYLGATADFNNIPPDIKKIVKKVEVYTDAVIQIETAKESFWQGNKIPAINDPADNRSSVSGGARFYLLETDKFKAGVLAEGGYQFGDHAIQKIGGLFIGDKNDVVKVDLKYENIHNSKYETSNGDLIGIGVNLDLYKIVKKIEGVVKSAAEAKEKSE